MCKNDGIPDVCRELRQGCGDGVANQGQGPDKVVIKGSTTSTSRTGRPGQRRKGGHGVCNCGRGQQGTPGGPTGFANVATRSRRFMGMGAAKRRTRGGRDPDTEPSHRARPQSSGARPVSVAGVL